MSRSRGSAQRVMDRIGAFSEDIRLYKGMDADTQVFIDICMLFIVSFSARCKATGQTPVVHLHPTEQPPLPPAHLHPTAPSKSKKSYPASSPTQATPSWEPQSSPPQTAATPLSAYSVSLLSQQTDSVSVISSKTMQSLSERLPSTFKRRGC